MADDERRGCVEVATMLRGTRRAEGVFRGIQVMKAALIAPSSPKSM